MSDCNSGYSTINVFNKLSAADCLAANFMNPYPVAEKKDDKSVIHMNNT